MDTGELGELVERSEVIEELQFTAIVATEERLTEEGQEVFKMLLVAVEQGIPILTAYEDANGIDRLGDREIRAIENFVTVYNFLEDYKESYRQDA